MGRLRKNVHRMIKIAGVARSRVASWKGVASQPDEELDDADHWLGEVEDALRESESRIALLERKDWHPPKRTNMVVFSNGDQVRVNDKHSEKYRKVYGKGAVENLIVHELLETGEVVVKVRMKNHPDAVFIVSKSHIERRKES